ncbi:MAG: phage tail tube protein [Acetobacteraceae bacterium]|nr:phage tail tube protein [Acetobacteraceae bacterium]
MASIERGGVAYFYVDGALYDVKAEITVKLGGIVRTPVTSSNAVVGFSSKIAHPEITMEALDGPAVSIAALKAFSSGVIQVRMNNGKAYQLFNAFQIDDPEVKAADGSVSGIKFSGTACQELLGS